MQGRTFHAFRQTHTLILALEGGCARRLVTRRTAMLNYAYRRRWIDDPPPRVLYPAPQKRRDDILSDQEMDRLVQSAQAMGG